ncbi:hypothetical protein MUN78_15385 [Leucobacter allii]|uniref:DUF2207 domain-containing protein n=1 Tax=Leucobacter allii TaxID=2932247 RepID=A0ABY4FL91_9MICO|nr:hypothetical protein [Leucobacter allii]UOQ57025.1 hypothetical protein MUN78_15385 [Leucobacter allii]
MMWPFWIVIALVALFVIGMPLLIRRAIRDQDRPIPLIDRSRAYPATVIRAFDTSGAETAEPNVRVAYVDADGEARERYLADVIDDSWLDRFAPGSVWWIHAYSPETTRVVLTEAHEEVWRCGWNVDGVHGLGGSSGPVDVGPGSPFPHRPRGCAS